jgi:hypothetical protein
LKFIHTILREDFGQLDRHSIRAGLLAEVGVHGVTYEPARNGLCIEYDPAVLTATKLADLICRHCVYPDPAGSSADAPKRSDG